MILGKFRSGPWEGSITIKGKQQPLALQLVFTDEEVQGEGTINGDVPITVSGTYTTNPPYSCDLTFTYTLSQSTITLAGWRESQQGGIFGSFSSEYQGKGSFGFQPCKEDSPPQPNNSALLHELEGMGFPTWVCKQAVEVTKELGAAVEICFSLVQGESGGGNQNAQGTTSSAQDAIIENLVGLGFSKDDATLAAAQTSSLEEALDLVIQISQKE
eukprot:Phypoly_transcript_14685.p1 GENE.Phypoly_transcript_14685~~Phypoly_transcript_14685.p1  ORF type:complete len:215 (+),score=35.47 Phypoly_transcript_14685:157-801(+)